MKKNIKKLELKKLFKEFGFLKIDEEYKNELLNMYGHEFSSAIQKIFKEQPELDLLFNHSKETKIAQEMVKNQESAQTIQTKMIGVEIYDPLGNYTELELYTGNTQQNIFKEENPKSDNVKKLYRKIATKTHPDKVSVKYLNELYLKSKTAYQNNDVFTLYLICNELEIEYEFSKEEEKEFKNTLKNLRKNNMFVEQTYLWAWINEEDEIIRSKILRHFITTSYKPI